MACADEPRPEPLGFLVMTKRTKTRGGCDPSATLAVHAPRLPRGPAATPPRPARDVAELATALALADAEAAGLRARERLSESSAVTDARRGAERRARRAKAKLVAAIGRSQAELVAAALAVEGHGPLRAAAEAAPDLRDHAVQAMLNVASIVCQRGFRDTASVLTLVKAQQYAALESALLARIMREGIKPELLKLASMCNANARLSLLSADHLSRHGGTPVEEPTESLAERLTRLNAADDARLAEVAKRQGLDDDDEP
jgi:hypothetical protein